jgi:hypothetical protein
MDIYINQVAVSLLIGHFKNLLAATPPQHPHRARSIASTENQTEKTGMPRERDQKERV